MWTTPLVTIVRKSYAHSRNRLRMPMEEKSRGNLRQFKTSIGLTRVIDGLPPTHKGAHGRQTAIQGQEHIINSMLTSNLSNALSMAAVSFSMMSSAALSASSLLTMSGN